MRAAVARRIEPEVVRAAREAREANGGALPSLDFAKPVGHDGEHLPNRIDFGQKPEAGRAPMYGGRDEDGL